MSSYQCMRKFQGIRPKLEIPVKTLQEGVRVLGNRVRKIITAKKTAVSLFLGLAIISLGSVTLNAQELGDERLASQVQDLKQDILELNKALFILEEELLYPSNTQLAVFLSMDIGYFFALDAVKLTLNGKVVSNYLYTERQLDALVRGGVQRLFIGNLKKGEHELVAVFTGRGPQGRDYRRATSISFEKSAEAKFLELQIVDQTANNQPEFTVKEW